MATNNKTNSASQDASRDRGQYCECPNCEGYMGMGYHKSFFLRWVLGILILLITFWIGLKMGEFKGMFENEFRGYGGYHRGMMFDNGYYYPGMMNWTVPTTGDGRESTTTTPKTTTK